MKTLKKVIIIYVVIGVLIMARIRLFESVSLPLYREHISSEENYELKYLFRRSVTRERGFLIKNARQENYYFMFQWDYDRLVEEVRNDLYKKLDELVEQYPYVSSYNVDEIGKVIMISYDNEQKDGKNLFVDDFEIEKISFLLARLTKSETEYKIYKYNEVSSKKEDNKKSAYNEKEINCLEKILSRSKNKKVFDYNDEWKIRGYEDGGNIWYLDLSDYSDITGRLDLSDFTKLRYVALKGMNIDSVVLPESLVSIDPNTFNNCKNLTKITIPKSVTSFLNPVFSGCKSLKEIVFEENAPEVSLDNEDVFGKVLKDLIIYRKKSAKGWQEICWDKYDVRIIDE